MYRLTRTSTAPASPLKIMIAKPDGADAGLTAGGSFVLEPGDVIQVDAYVAGVIMGDSGLAQHFECIPAWHPPDVAIQPDAAPASPEPSKWEPSPRRRGR